MSTPATDALALRRVPYDAAVVQALVAQVQDEFVGIYGNPDRTPLDAAMFAPPDGAFFVGWSGEVPVAIGGWRRRPDVVALDGSAAAEVKRMFVVPSARGRGHARAVLARLESSARSCGADVMVLESGARQPEALALYASSGYVGIPGYGLYRDSPLNRCLAKRL